MRATSTAAAAVAAVSVHTHARSTRTQLPLLHSQTTPKQEVEIEFAGVERVDTSWVAPTYRRGTPPINSDKRKVRPDTCTLVAAADPSLTSQFVSRDCSCGRHF